MERWPNKPEYQWWNDICTMEEQGAFDIIDIKNTDMEDVEAIEVPHRPELSNIDEEGNPIKTLEYFNLHREYTYGKQTDTDITPGQKKQFSEYIIAVGYEQVIKDIRYFFNEIAPNMRNHHIGIFLSSKVKERLEGGRR